jgi:hypothetical protein
VTPSGADRQFRRTRGEGEKPAKGAHSLSRPEPVIAHAKGIEMSQIQPRNAFASYRRVDLTESIHTRKEIFQSGHPTDIQHH